MAQDLTPSQDSPQGWWNAKLLIGILIVIAYGWTVLEPYAGDALMHMMDDTQVHSLKDIFRVFYSSTNPLYQEQHRLTGFHRPVFNELYVTSVKALLGAGSPWIRALTLLMLVASAWIFIECMRKLHLTVMPAIVGSGWLVFSPSLFFGLYEFGLAFTQLLVLLALASIYALIKHLESDGKVYARAWLFVFLSFVFLTVFTKESAVTWPVACLCILAGMLSLQTKSTGSVSFKASLKSFVVDVLRHRLLLVASTLFICFSYLVTRYLKLGSLTNIAGGIEQSPSALDSVIKFLGYSLLTVQVPSSIIPAYLTVSLQHMGWVEIVVRLMVFLSAVLLLRAAWKKNRIFALAMFLSFFFLFLPITKVSRNSPYYADLMMIPLAIALAFGADATFKVLHSRTKVLITSGILMSLTACATFFAARYVFNPDMWLTRSQGFARAALSDFLSAEGAFDAEQIVGTSGMFGEEQNWALNHNDKIFGAGFSSNLGMPMSKFVRQSWMVKKNEKVLFVDFLPDMQPRKIGNYPLPGYGKLTSVYFPDGFVRRRLEGSPPIIEIKGSKLISVTCNNDSVSSLPISFKSQKQTLILSRALTAVMNTGRIKGKTVFEVIVPSTASFLQFEDASNCDTPTLDGYYDFDFLGFNYKKTINLSPRFENNSDWMGNMTKAQRGDGVIVGPGADNTNVLSQRIQAQPSQPIKIVAHAASVGKPNSTGRLQINWVGPNDEFISSSSKNFTASSNEQEFATFFVAPPGVKAGYVYVSPHAPEDTVRYTEMRVLGGSSN